MTNQVTKNQQVATNSATGIQALKTVLNNESIKKKFFDMLGKKSQGFITSVINVCTNNEMLSKADANSVVLAAANAAALDLPIDPNLGYAAIIPFYDKNKNAVVASLQIERNGWVELAQRTGKVKSIENELVYEGELVSKNRFSGEYVFDETKRKSDKIIGVMAYLKTTNGFEKTVYWSVEECKAHGLKYSQTFKKGYGLWVTNPEAMYLKSVLKHLIVKYAPKSIELNNAIVNDQAAFVGDFDHQTPVYVDNSAADDFEEYQEVPDGENDMQVDEKTGTVSYTGPAQNSTFTSTSTNGLLFETPSAEKPAKQDKQ